ncbi:MAG: MipA/OmpV family protein [Acidobacteriota bacterium]
MALAQPADSGGGPPANAGGPPNFIAFGVGFIPEYPGSDELRPIPFGGAQYSTSGTIFSWRGLSIVADVLALRTRGRWTGGVGAAFQFGRDDDTDLIQINALPDIDDTIEALAFIGRRWSMPGSRASWTLQLEARVDAASVHDGYVVTPSLSYGTPVGDRLRLDFSVRVPYGSEDFVDTYYSITEAGSFASGLPVYTASSGFYEIGVSVNGTYSFNDRWGLFALLGYSRVIGDAADSPIVDVGSDASQIIGLATSYRF